MRLSSRSLADMKQRLTELPVESSQPKLNFKAGRKPIRQSGLRKTANIADDDHAAATESGHQVSDEDDGPRVVRPNAARSKSSGFKKKQAKTSQLSFQHDAGEGEEPSDAKPTKKTPFGQRVLENSAAKRGFVNRGLPLRSADDDDRPRYSKEYLDELQSSTPNTPLPLSTEADTDPMDLDSSELDGALIVESEASSSRPQTTILTDAEIQERKERRARLGKEQDFLSVEDDDNVDQFGRKQKAETRLTAEDEELGEGFDNYVEDGGLALGKRAEKERRKRDRQHMADMINAAEGNTSDSSSDSDAERRIAYEAAQTRAGMDGLKKPKKSPAEDILQVPPKVTPIPSLSECLSRLQVSVKTLEDEIKTKTARVQNLRSEKGEISKREAEVQALLDETGKKYQEAMGKGNTANGATSPDNPGSELGGERGLESLGATPSRADVEPSSPS